MYIIHPNSDLEHKIYFFKANIELFSYRKFVCTAKEITAYTIGVLS